MSNSNGADPPKEVRKRRWGASCEVCRRKRQKCLGRDENGISLCTYCPSVGIQCTYQQAGVASQLDQALNEAAELRSLLKTLVPASHDERATILAQWAASNDSGTAPPKKRPRRQDVDIKEAASTLPLAANRLKHTVDANEIEDVAGQTECEAFTVQLASSALASAPDVLLPSEMQILLDSFFCWQNPRFLIPREEVENYVQGKGSFMCSELLLWAIYTHTARLVPAIRSRSEQIAARAHILLAAELTRPASIPTTLGAIVLSMFHATQGRYSQSSTMLGIAHRLLQDRVLRAERGKTIMQIRWLRRAAWIAFQWGMMYSLIVNRPSPVPCPEFSTSPQDLFSEEELAKDKEYWAPYYTDQEISVPYQPCPAQVCATFIIFSEAFRFVDLILRTLYGEVPLKPKAAEKFVYETREALLSWHAQLGPEVLMDIDSLPQQCPPPYIVVTNLLIRSIWILLYRKVDEAFTSTSPMLGAHQAGLRSAAEICAILKLFNGTFPRNRMNYVGINAAEMAAVTDAQALRRCSPEERTKIAGRLSTYIVTLEEGETNCPGFRSMIMALREVLKNQSSTGMANGGPKAIINISQEEIDQGLAASDDVLQIKNISATDFDFTYDPNLEAVLQFFNSEPNDTSWLFSSSGQEDPIWHGLWQNSFE